MSNLTNEQKVQQALDAAIPGIVEGLKRDLTAGITEQIRSKVLSQMVTTVEEWYKDNMAEEVKTVLINSKLGLLGSIVPFAEELQKVLVTGMLANVTKNLDNSYTRNKIMEALFK